MDETTIARLMELVRYGCISRADTAAYLQEQLNVLEQRRAEIATAQARVASALLDLEPEPVGKELGGDGMQFA